MPNHMAVPRAVRAPPPCHKNTCVGGTTFRYRRYRFNITGEQDAEDITLTNGASRPLGQVWASYRRATGTVRAAIGRHGVSPRLMGGYNKQRTWTAVRRASLNDLSSVACVVTHKTWQSHRLERRLWVRTACWASR